MNVHRPFSILSYCVEETTTESFVITVPIIEPLRQGKNAHTARAMKAVDMQTKLLAIPCAMERHCVFAGCVIASIAAAQVAACKVVDEYALTIARDRLRLSIGALKSMGTVWPLMDKMAKEVRQIARESLFGPSSSVTSGPSSSDVEVEMARDDLIWPVPNPSTQIDIFSGFTIPMDWNEPFNVSSSSSHLS